MPEEKDYVESDNIKNLLKLVAGFGIKIHPDIKRVAHTVGAPYGWTLIMNSSIFTCGKYTHEKKAERYPVQRDMLAVIAIALRQPADGCKNATGLSLLTSLEDLSSCGVQEEEVKDLIKKLATFCDYKKGAVEQAGLALINVVAELKAKVDNKVEGFKLDQEKDQEKELEKFKRIIVLQNKLDFLSKGLAKPDGIFDMIKRYDKDPKTMFHSEADEAKTKRLMALDRHYETVMKSLEFNLMDTQAVEAAAEAAVEAATAEAAAEAAADEAAADEAAVVEAAAAEAAVEAAAAAEAAVEAATADEVGLPTTLEVNIANMYEVEERKLVNAQHLRHQSLKSAKSAIPIESGPSPERVQKEKLAAFVEFMKSDNLGNDMTQKLSDAGFYDANVSDSVLKCIVGQCHNDYRGKKQKRKRHTLREKVKAALGPDSTYRNKHQLAGVWMDKLGSKRFSWGGSKTRKAITKMAEKIRSARESSRGLSGG